MKKIYGLIQDCGDGSAGILWFENRELADKLKDNLWADRWGLNGGSLAEVLTFPDDFDLAACGIEVSDQDYNDDYEDDDDD